MKIHLKYNIREILIIILFVFFSSCQNETYPTLTTINFTKTSKTKLGETNYYLLLPDGYKIEEVRGKEGYLGYNIFPASYFFNPYDTTVTSYGTIQIEKGNPIGEDSEQEKRGKSIYGISKILGKNVKWTIDTTVKYFNVYTTERDNLNGYITVKNKNEIDTFISIIATLQR